MASKTQNKFYTDPKSIPSEIVNGFDPARKAKAHEAFKKLARRSNFNVLINPNVSYKGLDPTGRKFLAEKLTRTKNALTAQIESGMAVKDIGFGKPNLLAVEGIPEIGQKRGFIHIAVNYRFDEKCHLDYDKVRQVVKASLAPLNPTVKIRYFQDKGAVETAYATKAADNEIETVQQIQAGVYRSPPMLFQSSVAVEKNTQ